MVEHSSRTLRKYNKLLAAWDHKCVLCGEGFDDIESVTREHLIPRTIALNVLKRKNSTRDNLAPSHFRCNQLRGTLSLVDSMVILDTLKDRMGIREFRCWVNERVPNRYAQVHR